MADAVELEVMETTAVGQAAFRDGDIETAKFSFGRVLELDPSNQAVRQMLRLVEMTAQSAAATRAASTTRARRRFQLAPTMGDCVR